VSARSDPTVDLALARAHGLSDTEWARACTVLGRTPAWPELGVLSVMWSEHCSYKSSRVFLRRLPTQGPRVLQGPGENAGVVDIGDGWCVAFKMESHNHPSFIEPYQGAATGVGGILRDVFTMGARPVASLNSLRFGRPDHPRTASLVSGVVAGIGGYGNCVGIPTVGGEVQFDPSYDGNILVNAFAAGVARTDRLFFGRAKGVGNPVIYLGAKTGRDGIHGATMASASFDDGSEQKRPTVQVGDPFMEKLLLEACLEVMSKDLLEGIQDMGAAGLTSSSVEMAGRAGTGIEMDLDAVPRRAAGMTPYELLLSESQERMVLVARSGCEEEVLTICRKWDLDACVVGRVTDTKRFVAKSEGRVVCDLPVSLLTDEAPRYERPVRRPADLDALRGDDPGERPPPEDLSAFLLQMVGSPNLCSRAWVWHQYDSTVGASTVAGPGGDAAVVRLFCGEIEKAIAVAVDCNGRHVLLDPRRGAALAVAECARNLVCVGAEPIAVTDCLNFGSPERPEILWQFAEAVEGISEACRALETPVVSGNVSFYNETNGVAILPTPTIGMVGQLRRAADRVGAAFLRDGDVIALVGESTDGCLGGSEYAFVRGWPVSGPAPALDLDRERAVQRTVLDAAHEGILSSAHDCSEGGLAVCLAESCVAGQLGARVSIPGGLPEHRGLFGEDPSRIVVSLAAGNLSKLVEIARNAGAAVAEIGRIEGDRLVIDGVDVAVSDLSRVHASGFQAIVDL